MLIEYTPCRIGNFSWPRLTALALPQARDCPDDPARSYKSIPTVRSCAGHKTGFPFLTLYRRWFFWSVDSSLFASKMAASQPSPKRQCWECLRRRLVCDFTQPSCKKCIRAGVECPGYDEKKPLKWLEPGKVASKRRSPKNSQKGKNRASKEPISSGKTKSSTPGTTLVIRDNRGSSSSEDTDGVEEIPRFDLKDETHDVVQAIHYCKLFCLL